MSVYTTFTDVPSALALMKKVDELRAEIASFVEGNVIGSVSYPLDPHRIYITGRLVLPE